MITEIFKPIPNYPNYEISNIGTVKSLPITKHIGGKKWCSYVTKEIIRKPSINNKGYLRVVLSKNGKTKTFSVHQLVAIAFLNHTPTGYNGVVNHKDLNKLNNNVNNLEIITQRENSNQRHMPATSKYVGVSFDKNISKWKSSIKINGKSKHIGYFLSEIEASNAYQKAINNL